MLLTQERPLARNLIVILFTSALFLSGYAVQQKTLAKLRAAVSQQMAPRPSPKIYLPDRFKQSTTELEDGTVVSVEEDGGDYDTGRNNNGGGDNESDGIIVEVRPTTQDDVEGSDSSSGGSNGGPQKPLRPLDSGEENRGFGAPHQGKYTNKAAAGGEAVVEEAGAAKEGMQEEQPISRAERRRRIKAEIQRLSQGDEPVYYQRRLW
ncbi:hypothetical protein SLS62_003423 [Diatrype stigma]|uniref:Uncharacterized protein n=1 Tax=Diatrype stigma TaxID=117547 RepID=A0AAN9YUC3_9PEZI